MSSSRTQSPDRTFRCGIEAQLGRTTLPVCRCAMCPGSHGCHCGVSAGQPRHATQPGDCPQRLAARGDSHAAFDGRFFRLPALLQRPDALGDRAALSEEEVATMQAPRPQRSHRLGRRGVR